ncbi:MAG: ABC transporter permease [Nitrososphaerales archaeon]
MTQKDGNPRFASVRKFLREYRRNRLGIAGAVIIIVFLILALSAPLLATHNPINDQYLASPYSIPSWARAFPQYSDYPVNSQLLSGTSLSNQAALSSWNIVSKPSASDPTKGFVTYTPTASGLVVNFKPKNSSSSLLGQFNPSAATIDLNQTIPYKWMYPCGFQTSILVTPLSKSLSTTQFTIDMYMKSVGGRIFHILGPAVYTDPTDSQEYYNNFNTNHTYNMFSNPSNPKVSLLATGSTAVISFGACGLSQGIFAHPGNVTLSLVLSSTVPASVIVSNAQVFVAGSAYGLLGTDELGRDVWSQFVYGAQVSLGVGLFAAIIAVVIGTVVGLVAGFAGGIVDEVLMRTNDFLLILPFLPLILVVLEIISVSGVGKSINTEVLILLFIGLLGWNGIARIIRSQVLTVKQRQFVEASKALGSKDRHIIWKHILPNVMGLVYANTAITVPSAILTEAALTFLGFGDPSTISWGTMLSNAQPAFTSTLHSFVWWWFFPPGIAIALLSMSFIFVGFSLDAILNPRLRQR